MKFIKQLPMEHRLQYNSPNLNKVRPLLDSIIADILGNPKVVNDYYAYIEKLYDIDFQNKDYYGVSKEDNFVDKQIKKLYARIGNDILSKYKEHKQENYLNSQQEFLSKNIFKFNLKLKNNITENQLIDLGVSLYKISELSNLNQFDTKRLIKNWYTKTNPSNGFESYYKQVLDKQSNAPSLSISELFKTFEYMGISKAKYEKLRDKYYHNKFIKNQLFYNALQHIRYENKKLEKEIIYEMNNL